MSQLRQIVVRGALLLAVSQSLGAQSGGAAGPDPFRWSLAPAIDMGSVPDEYSVRCDDGIVPSVGAGVALLFRPRKWLVFEGDTRVSAIPRIGCHVVVVSGIYPPGYIFPGTREFSADSPHLPFARSALRFGIETPADLPLFRATAGVGAIWTGRVTPFETVAIGTGSRGPNARFYAELEVSMSRLRIGVARPVPPAPWTEFVSRVAIPTWASLHLGVEFPLASGR